MLPAKETLMLPGLPSALEGAESTAVPQHGGSSILEVNVSGATDEPIVDVTSHQDVGIPMGVTLQLGPLIPSAIMPIDHVISVSYVARKEVQLLLASREPDSFADLLVIFLLACYLVFFTDWFFDLLFSPWDTLSRVATSLLQTEGEIRRWSDQLRERRCSLKF